MKTYPAIDSEADFSDKIVLHYTGSMFGIGTFISNTTLINKISLIKCRTSSKGFVVLLGSINEMGANMLSTTKRVRKLLRHFWPGELTVLLKYRSKIFERVQKNSYIGVRVPSDELLRSLISEYKTPFLSSSVNLTGRAPETSLKKILKQFPSWFDCALIPEGIEKADSVPSTIVKVDKNKLSLIREGSIPFKDILGVFEDL